MTIGKLRLRPGFVLLAAALVYIDEGGLLWITGVAALLHEAGHYIALRAAGGRVCLVELSAGGVSMVQAPLPRIGYGREIFAVLAGPLASLLSALLFSLGGGIIREYPAVGGLCLVQGLFNLLPARGLDGGRALWLILERAGARDARRVLCVTTALSAFFLAALGAALFFLSGGNLLPLVSAACVLPSLWVNAAKTNILGK